MLIVIFIYNPRIAKKIAIPQYRTNVNSIEIMDFLRSFNFSALRNHKFHCNARNEIYF